MLMINLFDKDNILCPEWLSNELLEDDWEDSVYSYEDDKHTWILKNDIMNNRITFDGNECTFLYFSDVINELIPFRVITENSAIEC